MMNLFLITGMFLAVSWHLAGSETGFSAIQLLEGYTAKQASAIDATVWTIQGKNGLVIHFEAGPSEGGVVELKDNEKYTHFSGKWTKQELANLSESQPH